MFNILLDPLPQDWNGYPIDTDFQTGILISQCLEDQSLNDREKFYTAAGLLFPGERPGSAEEVAEALNWYMTGYNHDNKTKQDAKEAPVMDWDMDQWRIYAAFRGQYGIDLNTARMHWFVFMGLLSNIEECTFTHVMEIRRKKITARMSAEEKAVVREAKKVFAIRAQEQEADPEEKKRVEEFLKYASVRKST